jgi:hypothetical protein
LEDGVRPHNDRVTGHNVATVCRGVTKELQEKERDERKVVKHVK